MENQAFYDDLFTKVKDSLNYQETQELKSFQKENIPLLEKKIRQLRSGIKFSRIVMFTVLSLLIIFAFLLQMGGSPKLSQFIIFFLMVLPIGMSNAIGGKNSLPALQKKIDTFEFMLILTKDEWIITR